MRAAPGGIATPAFGDEPTVLRLDGARLVVERGAGAAILDVDGATLARLADAAGADLTQPLDVGRDTPPLGDVDEPIDLDHAVAVALGRWFGFGWRVLDEVVAAAGRKASPTTIQLWPEHFDAGCDVAVGPGPDDRCNLGASPGDDERPEPYLYVGPWTTARPGDRAYWNAGFGATLGLSELRASAHPLAAGVAFCGRGLELLREAARA